MSIIDKVVAAVTPLESEQARIDARAKARAVARPGDWLSSVLDHHQQIERAFDAVKSAEDLHGRRSAQKWLSVILTGHSNAEESVLYPALANLDEKGHAELAYTEQSMAKIEMAALESLDPMSQAYLDKLEHIRGAVAHHMYEEEGTWFLELRDKASAIDQPTLTERYREEFARYVGNDQARAAA